MGKFKKFLTILLSAVAAAGVLGALAACSEEHTHTYADGWTHDENYHWHAATCEHTDEVSGKEAHTFESGVCTVCSYDNGEGSVQQTAEMKSASIIVTGTEGGANVSGVVAEFNGTVSGFDKDTFTVRMGTTYATRTVTDIYSSDSKGNKSSTATSYVTMQLKITANYYGTDFTPFNYDMTTGFNSWINGTYKVRLVLNDGKSIKVGDATVTDKTNFDATLNPSEKTNVICPQLDGIWSSDKYTYKDGSTEIKLNRGWYKPDGATGSGGDYPLIVWLHGQGEGSYYSDDIYIDLLGNEVSALGGSAIQSYFTKGAYVLAVQSPTMWMDMDGNITSNGTATEGQPSYYTEALFAAIKDYVDNNKDIDASRIYIGGCSNGGYMTMNLAFTHGDYFAAYYPVCEAYYDAKITDKMIESIKDYNIWFVQAQNDTTVNPSYTTIPTYVRLLEAGAQNVHFYMPAKVLGNDTGTEVEYMGHWSWIYVFNDEVKKEFDNSQVTGSDYLVAENCTKDGNMWTWMAAQTKGETQTPSSEPSETYMFEAENAAFTSGTAYSYNYWTQAWEETTITPTVETKTQYTGTEETGEEVTAVGYFYGDGATISWTITAADACDVTLTLYAASSDVSYVNWPSLSVNAVEFTAESQPVGLKVNGESVNLAGTVTGIETISATALADYSYYANYVGTVTASVHLDAGENVITLVAPADSGKLNIDKIVLSGTETVLSYVPVDNG